MSRFFRVLILLTLVAACGSGGRFSAPRNLDNACSIARERPQYMKAFRAAERKWGVPVHVQMASMYQESKFIGNARPPVRYRLGVIPNGRLSSAYGYSQALDGTWDDYKKSAGRRGARRDNIRDATDFMGWYKNESLRANGIALTDATQQYLAYHEGQTGYARGSHFKKAWLMRVAREVGERAAMYERQLARCGR